MWASGAAFPDISNTLGLHETTVCHTKPLISMSNLIALVAHDFSAHNHFDVQRMRSHQAMHMMAPMSNINFFPVWEPLPFAETSVK